MNYNAWANFSMSLYQVTLFYVSFTQLQQWTEFTMNDVEHYLMWTLWNYIIVNFTWVLNDIWMDVKWFEWNFNKQFKEWNISSVIILLASNPAQRLPWYSVELTSARMHYDIKFCNNWIRYRSTVSLKIPVINTCNCTKVTYCNRKILTISVKQNVLKHKPENL